MRVSFTFVGTPLGIILKWLVYFISPSNVVIDPLKVGYLGAVSFQFYCCRTCFIGNMMVEEFYVLLSTKWMALECFNWRGVDEYFLLNLGGLAYGNLE